MPGFARVLASTIYELRLEGISPGVLAAIGEPCSDLAVLLEAYAQELAAQALADLASLFGFALETVERGVLAQSTVGRLSSSPSHKSTCSRFQSNHDW
jgi:hypothetical protein